MTINKLLKVMEMLRDPQNGCAWNKKQTLESIIPHSIEEVYEVAEEIYKKDYENLRQELGDLLFQIVYLSQIAKEKKKFIFNDVVKSITEKMISRHPHVFEGKKFKNINEFNKFREKSKNKQNSGLLDDIPKKYPPLTKANKIQKKVAKVGFEYKNDLQAVDKIIEEANELKKEIKKKNIKNIKKELGDLIFSTLDVSRKLNLDPGIILSKANNKFIKRWKKIEILIKKDKKEFENLNLNDFNKYWEIAKKK
tara:strand:+ start:504 stop:1259 length:756 start_codon:yes stop_codon:yes gene_type:complete